MACCQDTSDINSEVVQGVKAHFEPDHPHALKLGLPSVGGLALTTALENLPPIVRGLEDMFVAHWGKSVVAWSAAQKAYFNEFATPSLVKMITDALNATQAAPAS